LPGWHRPKAVAIIPRFGSPEPNRAAIPTPDIRLSLTSPTDGTHPVLLCLYAPHLPVGSSRIEALDPMPALAGLNGETEVLLAGDLASALQAAQLAAPGRALLLLDTAADLTPYTALRLLRLGRVERLLSLPRAAWLRDCLSPSHSASDAELDALCWRLGEPQPLPSLAFNPAAALVPARAVPTMAELAAAGSFQVPADIEAALYLRGCSGGSASAGTAPGSEPMLRALAERLSPLLGSEAARGYPGLDGRPVLLHALHGWGGGSARFVADLISARDDCHHLVLQAESEPGRQLPGAALSLRHQPGAPALKRHSLAAPITATALQSGECREFIDAVRRDFGVSGVLVSSLIGLSLDMLRTGLPTAVVCHDYHPLWPSLHADFGAADFDDSESALRRCLEAQGQEFPFGERRPQAWLQLRGAYVETLLQAQVQLLAPTRTVLDNLLRLAPELHALAHQVIPHGLAPWPTPFAPVQPPERPRLRVLVPGRINGGKGEQLLAGLIPQLPDEIELVLLGCGAAGMRFFGARGVHVRLDYLHAELPRAAARGRGPRPSSAGPRPVGGRRAAPSEGRDCAPGRRGRAPSRRRRARPAGHCGRARCVRHRRRCG
jgi:O-antigen biosynthesis protein